MKSQLFILFFPLFFFSQENLKDSLVEFKLDCDSVVTIKIPKGFYNTVKSNYEAGYYLTFLYPDQSYVSILCGEERELKLKEKKKKHLHYRREEINGYEIMYEDVPAGRMKIFNSAFDALTKKK